MTCTHLSLSVCVSVCLCVLGFGGIDFGSISLADAFESFSDPTKDISIPPAVDTSSSSSTSLLTHTDPDDRENPDRLEGKHIDAAHQPGAHVQTRHHAARTASDKSEIVNPNNPDNPTNPGLTGSAATRVQSGQPHVHNTTLQNLPSGSGGNSTNSDPSGPSVVLVGSEKHVEQVTAGPVAVPEKKIKKKIVRRRRRKV